MMLRTIIQTIIFLVAAPVCAAETVVYTAKLIRTMEPALPLASAVAVEDGRVVAVGTLDSLAPLIEDRDARIDRRFDADIILPGFIDPHVHPSLPAVLTQFPFLAPDDWSLPTGEFPGATTPADYQRELTRLVANYKPSSIPFITWGYHPLWHGEIWRDTLNDWFSDTPVML